MMYIAFYKCDYEYKRWKNTCDCQFDCELQRLNSTWKASTVTDCALADDCLANTCNFKFNVVQRKGMAGHSRLST